jgi:hypothetical protein
MSLANGAPASHPGGDAVGPLPHIEAPAVRPRKGRYRGKQRTAPAADGEDALDLPDGDLVRSQPMRMLLRRSCCLGSLRV